MASTYRLTIDVDQKDVQLSFPITEEEAVKYRDELRMQPDVEKNFGPFWVKIAREEMPVVWKIGQTKMLKDIKASDIPRGLSAEDIAIDCAPGYAASIPLSPKDATILTAIAQSPAMSDEEWEKFIALADDPNELRPVARLLLRKPVDNPEDFTAEQWECAEAVKKWARENRTIHKL